MIFLLRLFIGTIAVFITGYILPGVKISNFGSALVAAIVLGAVNAFLKPILVFLTLPITILTLGLFMFVINALLVQLAAAIVPGFEVKGFLSALLFSLVLTIISSILHAWTR